jgi:hypothetical protein
MKHGNAYIIVFTAVNFHRHFIEGEQKKVFCLIYKLFSYMYGPNIHFKLNL